MKVLWITGREFSEIPEKSSGAWQLATAMLLVRKGVEITNLGLGKRSSQDSAENEVFGISQIIFGKALSKEKIAACFEEILANNSFDCVQVWGVENKLWEIFLSIKADLPILYYPQGVFAQMSKMNSASLGRFGALKTLVPSVFYYRNGPFFDNKRFNKRKKEEKYLAQKSHLVVFQSEWAKSQFNWLPEQKKGDSFYALRDEFIQSKATWSSVYTGGKLILYSSCPGYPWKGLHHAIRIVKELKYYYPDVELRLAGGVGRLDFLGQGYFLYTQRLIKKFKLEENIKWLGSLNALQIVVELQNCHFYLNPSFYESYCVALQEAIAIGTPSIATFAGAMPELARGTEAVRYFQQGDAAQAAYLIHSAIQKDEQIAMHQDSKIAMERTYGDMDALLLREIENYKSIISKP